MTNSTSNRKRNWILIASTIFVLACAGAAAATYGEWWPRVRELVAGANEQTRDRHLDDGHRHDSGHGHEAKGHGHKGDRHDQGHADDDHGHKGHNHGVDLKGHDHGNDVHAGHNEANALELSESAWRNIGLKTGIVESRTYVKTVSVPAMVVERPGRSQVDITAPLTGIVTRVYPIEGEVTEPGEAIFDLRLTHEDLVTAQRDFLRSAEELSVVRREIDRLESAGEGVVAGRRVVEQQYEKQKIEATLHAQRQGLLLHALTDTQIDEILRTRTLLQTLTVKVPQFPKNGEDAGIDHLFHVQEVRVKPGQHVTAGESLAVLADHGLLYVEGQAFEDDAERLLEAANQESVIGVTVVRNRSAPVTVMQLKIVYVADHIDKDSRSLRFYMDLPNERSHESKQSGRTFVAWKFRPGQRMEVRIPLGKPWENQIVLPPEAVVDEGGAEAFVFEQNGSHFDRLPVHIIYRDNHAVVVENDGSMIGHTLAMSGAYRMHLELKKKAGVAIDPHAGHNH